MAANENCSLWIKKWEDGKTLWHLQKTHWVLQKYQDRLPQDSSNKKVFVPLCGKSLDLKLFYELGFTVVGVELYEGAVLQFFEENQLDYDVISKTNQTIYETKDSRLKIYVNNLYDVDYTSLGKFDIIWDRGSFVAITPEERSRYARIITDICAPGVVYILVSVTYDECDYKGPPSSISKEEIQVHYGNSFKVNLLESFDSDSMTKKARGLVNYTEDAYILEKN